MEALNRFAHSPRLPCMRPSCQRPEIFLLRMPFPIPFLHRRITPSASSSPPHFPFSLCSSLASRKENCSLDAEIGRGTALKREEKRKEEKKKGGDIILCSISPHILLFLAALPGTETIRSIFGPFVELVKTWNLPEWLVHWGHPGNMWISLMVSLRGFSRKSCSQINGLNSSSKISSTREICALLINMPEALPPDNMRLFLNTLPHVANARNSIFPGSSGFLPVMWLRGFFPQGFFHAVVLFAMGGYGSYLGFRIRLSKDAEERAMAKNLHPKLLTGMFIFFLLGATGGITALLTSDKPILESPHAISGLMGLSLLTVQSVLPALFKDYPGMRTVHGLVGSSIMTLFLIQAALGLQLGLSF